MDHIDKTIADLDKKLRVDEETVRYDKRMINDLLKLAGRPARFADSDINETSTASLGNIASDRWYGQPLFPSIREYMEMRRQAGQGPATIDEIFSALTEGGYKWAADTTTAKRGMAIAIAKNPGTFHKLPNNRIGLIEWYPKAQEEREKKKSSSPTPDAESGEAEEESGDDGEEGGKVRSIA